MQVLPERTKVNEALESICADKLFKRSPTNELLLRYLVDQAYKGTDLKEQIIGVELFKNDYKSEQNDSKIRVAVYYLRKKLESYYAESGKDEEIRFAIEKGQYNLSFIELSDVGKNEMPKSYIKFPVKYFWYAISGFLAVFFLFFVATFIGKTSCCWTNFFAEYSSTICVVADHFVVLDKTEIENKVYSINSVIKSEADLISFREKHPTQNLALSDFTLFTKMAPIAIHKLTQWFTIHDKDFSVRLESELRYEDVKENNLIYIGQAKTMNLSKSIFLSTSKCFRIDNDGYFFSKDTLRISYDTKYAKPSYKEYAIVSYMPLVNGKKAMFFVSNNDIGVIATVRNFTDQTWLSEFYKKLPSKTSYFNALFEVSGVQRTDRSCNLVELEVLE